MVKMFYFVLFLFFAVLNIFFEKSHNRKGIILTKPFLMPMLLCGYVSNVSTSNYLIVFALVCGFLGDVFLMFKKEFSILAGCGAFLAGHVFYILAFSHDFNLIQGVPVWPFLCLAAYAIAGRFLLRRLLPFMGNMKVPGTIYLAGIFIMSFTSFLRVYTVPLLSFLFPFIGSLIFILSDSILAFDMFKRREGDNGKYVMATYVVAQLLIIIGFIK